ncbi:unnamed protein product, partial [marine sediment metagenome]
LSKQQSKEKAKANETKIILKLILRFIYYECYIYIM